MTAPARAARRLHSPVGWPLRLRAVTVTPAERQSRLVVANRYPGQVIGVSIRLPDCDPGNDWERAAPHRSLSLLWAKPARWW